MSESIRVEPTRAETLGAVSASLLFCLDVEDRVLRLDEQWESAAPDASGRRSFDRLEVGKKLTHCIGDPSIRSIFKTLVDRARKGGSALFDYRSDTSEMRRWFTMSIYSPDGEIVEFSSRGVKTEAWTSKPQDETSEELGGLFLRLCSWCQCVAVPPDAWLPAEAAVEVLNTMAGDKLPQVTHSICPSCQKDLIAESRARRRV